ncbi:MAG: O-antigen ligase family protein [Gemmataceae bacterium]
MALFLFIVALCALVLRPTDFLQLSANYQIFLYAMLCCTLVSADRLLRFAQSDELWNVPLTLFVLLLLIFVVLSHAVQANLWHARHWGVEFAKAALFFLLFVCHASDERKFFVILKWLLCFTVLILILSLLQYFDIIHCSFLEPIPQVSFDTEGNTILLTRLVGSGTFNDPNDYCLLLNVGFFLTLFFFETERRLLPKAALALFACLFIGGVFLTQSRGGMMALLGAGMLWMVVKFGIRRSAPFLVLALVVTLFFLSTRRFDLAAQDDTGQQRIQLWASALMLFRGSPLFGIGPGNFAESFGYVVHNSFLHCFTELGYFAGTIFLSCFLYSLIAVYRCSRDYARSGEPLCRFAPYLLAILTTYCVGLFSISRAYVIPTYLILGVANAYLLITHAHVPLRLPKVNLSGVSIACAFSITFLGFMHCFVRYFANY